jgi:hypothetical protein
MMMNRSIRAWMILAIACLGGCAQQSVRVTGEWNQGASRPHTFKELLVVGVSPDYRQRCNFEWALAKTLGSDTTRAIASCSVMPAEEPLSRASIERVVTSTGVDGVVATRLVAAKSSVQEGGSQDTRGGGGYRPTDVGYGYYGMPVIYVEFATQQSILSLEHEFEIATQVYETHGASLVYTVRTKGKTQDSSDVVLVEVSSAIAARLRQDGLVH